MCKRSAQPRRVVAGGGRGRLVSEAPSPCRMGAQGFLVKTADFVFSLAIPIHSHIGMNALVTDYLPKAARGAPVGRGMGAWVPGGWVGVALSMDTCMWV